MKFLVYRELVRSRKVFAFSSVGAMAGCVLFILIALSFRVGNLAMLPQFIHDKFNEMNNSVSLPLLAMLSGLSMMSAASSDTENWGLWRMFRRSTPVTPLKFAAAKYIALFIYLIISFACAFILSVLFCAAADIPLTLEVCAVAVCCVEAVLLFSAAIQVVQTIMRSSTDKAALIMMFILVLPVSAAGLFFTENDIETGLNPESVTSFCVDILPFTPLILAVIFSAGIFLTAAGYKRREK